MTNSSRVTDRRSLVDIFLVVRIRSAPEWYGNPVLEVMLLDHDEPTNYEDVGERSNFKKFPMHTQDHGATLKHKW